MVASNQTQGSAAVPALDKRARLLAQAAVPQTEMRQKRHWPAPGYWPRTNLLLKPDQTRWQQDQPVGSAAGCLPEMGVDSRVGSGGIGSGSGGRSCG